MRAASTVPKTSGASVPLSPITSSLIQGVAKISRAICAVVTASLTVVQPAVLGSTRTPSSRMMRQNSCPSRNWLDSRRTETVTTSASAARTDLAITSSEGYFDVPSSSRDFNSTP